MVLWSIDFDVWELFVKLFNALLPSISWVCLGLLYIYSLFQCDYHIITNRNWKRFLFKYFGKFKASFDFRQQDIPTPFRKQNHHQNYEVWQTTDSLTADWRHFSFFSFYLTSSLQFQFYPFRRVKVHLTSVNQICWQDIWSVIKKQLIFIHYFLLRIVFNCILAMLKSISNWYWFWLTQIQIYIITCLWLIVVWYSLGAIPWTPLKVAMNKEKKYFFGKWDAFR